jgi:hypothetical protein
MAKKLTFKELKVILKGIKSRKDVLSHKEFDLKPPASVIEKQKAAKIAAQKKLHADDLKQRSKTKK